ncbi:MAG: hypothetical protein GY803_29600 [Chloroflexi bacterium]|nr:hypothetical protein [Chloroflexota bacterium]
MFTSKLKRSKFKFVHFALILGMVLVALALIANPVALAQHGDGEETEPEVVEPRTPSLHPAIPLLDEDGNHVLDSGKPVSTIKTCDDCHDAEFIASHSFHSDVGLSDLTAPGLTGNGRAWDTGSGLFGKWSPITYRYLSPEIDANTDLTTAEWVKMFGVRHVGGGPAQYSRSGQELTLLPPSVDNIEASIVDENGNLVAWNWEESGIVEMNCFLCHLPEPNNEARKETLHNGDFGWANTATLLGTGIVSQNGDKLVWNIDAFDENGELLPEFIGIQDPANENCGQCHGLVHVDQQTPMMLEGCTPEQWSTITTGQIMSPQKIAESGINIENKSEIRRSWDIHTERVVKCTECHYALNNPIYYRELTESRPDHLEFDPRRIDLGEFLYRPLHEFAKGASAQGALAPSLDNTLRTCADCHEAEATHDWLPYAERHMVSLSCESCHIPEMYAPARQYYDWTVVKTTGEPHVACRGVEGGGETFATALVRGYEPVLLPRPNGDGDAPLSPHNLVTSWYWVYGDPERPVPARDLQAAWLDGDAYHDDIMEAFDANKNGVIEDTELIIDSERKEALIAGKLEDLGLENLRIAGEIQPYNINHNVTHGEWATKDCQTCHSEDSRVTRPIILANHIPGGVMPTFVGNGTTLLNGAVVETEDGALYYEPQAEADGFYVLGHNKVSWIDWTGVLIFLGTIGGVFTHGGLRVWAARKNPLQNHEMKTVYMYTVYERLWHWLQTAVILLLTFTGLIIHKPDMFGAFSFSWVVQVHNVLAAILVANAALALFYHIASGEIKQYLPEPRGFFNHMMIQATFYLRGIFKGDEHPFEKTPEHKLNPLQQVTYLGLLNVLLPLQIITGALMWGVQRWPSIAAQFGGLPFLAPFHTIIAWLFSSFIVMHVYLTTTGPTPMANIRAMMMGWEEVETD